MTQLRQSVYFGTHVFDTVASNVACLNACFLHHPVGSIRCFYSYYYYAVTPFEFGGLLRAIEVILELYRIYVIDSLEPSFVA